MKLLDLINGTSKELKAAKKIILDNCVDSYKHLLKHPIFRGDSRIKTPTIENPTARTRRSIGEISNHYTVLIDSNPYLDCAKRSKSLICSTHQGKANQFMNSSDPAHVVFPFDGAKISWINSGDIWHLPVYLNNRTIALRSLGELLTNLGIPDTLEGMKKFEPESEYGKNNLRHLVGEDYENFLDIIYKALARSGINTCSPKEISEIPSGEGDIREVWIEGKALVVPGKYFKDLRELLK